ncbi:MAG: DUF86 domain-containing protein [Acidobacteriia bacterium]|nr:DUF86 domain-containing protein [Terriglobia bacterium]
MKRNRAYLLHIRDAIASLEDYAGIGKEAYLATPHWQDAIIRRLEVIGEASNGSRPRCGTPIRECPGGVSAAYETY